MYEYNRNLAQPRILQQLTSSGDLAKLNNYLLYVYWIFLSAKKVHRDVTDKNGKKEKY